MVQNRLRIPVLFFSVFTLNVNVASSPKTSSVFSGNNILSDLLSEFCDVFVNTSVGVLNGVIFDALVGGRLDDSKAIDDLYWYSPVENVQLHSKLVLQIFIVWIVDMLRVKRGIQCVVDLFKR
jgi:hypothetical protein